MTRIVKGAVRVDPVNAALQPTITIMQMLTALPYSTRMRVLETVLKFFGVNEDLLHD